MVKVKVIFPPINEPGASAANQQERVFDWTAPGPSVPEALEQAFREFNVVAEGDPHIARQCRSMSVGDLARAGGKVFVVDMVGFSEVDEEFAKEWVKRPYRERIFGPGGLAASR